MMSGEEETSVRVYRALFPLRSGLEPFVAMHMQEEFGQNWLRCAKRAGESSSDGPLDVYGLLKTMKAHWKRVFEKQFNQRKRYGVHRFTSVALELASMALDARNRTAHPIARLPDRSALRYLDAMHELLEAVEAPAPLIEELNRLYDEQRSSGSTDLPSTLSVTRIKDPNSDDLYEIWLLHKNEFSDEEIADGYDSFRRWISEVDQNDRLLPEEHELDDIMLALKCSNQVVGYLYAQHYIRRKLIFVSYIATDRTFRDAHCYGARKLFDELVKLCESRDSTWHAILGEVEQVKGRARRRAEALFREFQQHARQLAGLSNTRSGLFMIDFDYTQPVIRPEDLDCEPRNVEGVTQKLLYLARDVDSLQKNADGHYRLRGEEVISIFDTLLSCVYGDAYARHDRYQQYLQSVLETYKPKLIGGLDLIE